MSQLATARPLPRVRSARSTRPVKRELRVVVGAPKGHAVLAAAFVLLLTAGLIGVLVLNTAMAKGAFVLTDLQNRSNELADNEAALKHAIDEVRAPDQLAKRALDLGMVPASTAAFLRISDGAILGVAEPATADRAFTVVAQASSGAPAAPSAGSAAAAAESPAGAEVPVAPVLPEPGTTVTTEGTITRTTVVTLLDNAVETVVTSVDSATGATTSTTTRTPIPAAEAPAPDPAQDPAAEAAQPAN